MKLWHRLRLAHHVRHAKVGGVVLTGGLLAIAIAGQSSERAFYCRWCGSGARQPVAPEGTPLPKGYVITSSGEVRRT